jgi:hypothetical protein
MEKVRSDLGLCFVLALAAFGCGEGAGGEEFLQTAIYDYSSPIVAGYAYIANDVIVPSSVARDAEFEWVEKAGTGPNGDAFAQIVGIGGEFYGGNTCSARVGSIGVIGPGGVHTFLVYYDVATGNGANGITVGTAVTGHRYFAATWTFDSGAHHNFEIRDKTTNTIVYQGQRTKPAGCVWKGDSAQWLIERPGWLGTRRGLLNFGSATFEQARFWDSTWTELRPGQVDEANKRYTMRPSVNDLAVAGPLSSDLLSFTVTWLRRL